MDFIFGLGVYDGNRDPLEQTQGDQALFTVSESVVLESVGRPVENLSSVNEVEAVVSN